MKHLVVVMAAVLMFALVGCSKPISIGFVGPITGYAGKKGKQMMQAIKIAIEEKNAQGGIKGHSIKLEMVDNMENVEKTMAAFDKLSKTYGIIGPMELAEKAQAAKILLISPASKQNPSTPTRDYIFRNILGYEQQATVFAKYAYSVLNVKKVAILALTNSYSASLAADFKKSFEAEGGKVLVMETAVDGTEDFKDALNKVKSAKADGVYLPNNAKELGNMIVQIREMGISGKLLSSDIFSNPEVFEIARDGANGIYFANSPEDTGDVTPAREAFEKKYEKQWKSKADINAVTAYDSAKLLIAAIEKAYVDGTAQEKSSLNLNKEKIKDAMLATSIDGLVGQLTFLPNGDVINDVGIFDSEYLGYVQLGVYRLQDGKLSQVK